MPRIGRKEGKKERGGEERGKEWSGEERRGKERRGEERRGEARRGEALSPKRVGSLYVWGQLCNVSTSTRELSMEV
jgi:hypothetical protein